MQLFFLPCDCFCTEGVGMGRGLEPPTGFQTAQGNQARPPPSSCDLHVSSFPLIPKEK